MIRLFHVTSETAANSILSEGFRDGRGGYMLMEAAPGGLTDSSLSGVFVSNFPLGINEGCKDGGAILEIVLNATADEMFYKWEIVDEGKPYREFLIPAERLNAATVRRISQEEADKVEPAEFWNEYPAGEPEATFRALSHEVGSDDL